MAYKTNARRVHPGRHQRGQWTIVGSLVAIALLIGLAAWLLPGFLKPRGDAGGRTAIQMGQGAACSIYESQINDAIISYKSSHDGQPPASLDDLKKEGVTDDILHAPGCAFVLQNGRATEVGHGAAPSVTLTSPSAAPAPAPSTPGVTVAPGGIRVPTGGGSSPNISGGE